MMIANISRAYPDDYHKEWTHWPKMTVWYELEDLDAAALHTVHASHRRMNMIWVRFPSREYPVWINICCFFFWSLNISRIGQNKQLRNVFTLVTSKFIHLDHFTVCSKSGDMIDRSWCTL
jgi:hypothetical protein